MEAYDWLVSLGGAWVLVYGLLTVAIALAVLRPSAPPAAEPDWPPVAVLVAARNEAQRLPACLESLLALDYPPDRLQILVGDDASTDATAAVAAVVAQRDPRVRVLSIRQNWPGLYGKQNVLAQLAHQTTAPFLLFADADVWVPSSWAKSHVAALRRSDIGLSVGPTVVADRGLWSGVQALDWLVGTATLAAADRWNRPLTAVGNNLGLSRVAYTAVGGYESIPFSVTEDFALFRAVRAQSFRTVFLWGPAACSTTWAVDRLGDLIEQRRRWLHGGLQGPWYAVAAYGIYQVGPWLALGLGLSGGGWAWLLGIFGIDCLLLVVAARALGRYRLLRWVGVALPARLLLQVLVGLRWVRGGGVRWKGRRYAVG